MKAMSVIIVIMTIVLMNMSVHAEEENYSKWLQELNVPIWVNDIFYINKLKDKYSFSFDMNPCYLRGDFDGDSEPDVAITVKEISSGKLGMMIFHYKNKNFYIVGAGKEIGNGRDDFKWMTNWSVKRKGKVGQGAVNSPPPELIGEALYVEKAESASAIIYWNGEEYMWYQQGN